MALPVVFLVFLTSFILLTSVDWRRGLISLFIQYSGVFVLVGVSWPIHMALVKMITGWVAVIVLWLALTDVEKDFKNDTGPKQRMWYSGGFSNVVFRLMAAVVVVLVVVSLAERLNVWFPAASLEQVTGSLILGGIGLLQLGMMKLPSRAIIGLLTVLSGFEILYAAVEISTLVTSLLSAVTLGLALAGAYLILAPTMGSGAR